MRIAEPMYSKMLRHGTRTSTPPRRRASGSSTRRLRSRAGARAERTVRAAEGASGGATSVTSVNGSEAPENHEWEDPLPLGPPPPPSLPLDGLPPWLREQVESVAAATEAARDMALLLGLAEISTAVANKGQVVVKTGYTEPLQIWTASVARPGSRKSPVFGHMMRPIKSYEAEEEERYRARLRENENEREIIEQALKKAKKNARDALLDDEGYKEARDEVERLRERLAALEPSSPDVITVSDITAERLGQRMGEHFGRAAILSPEGDIFGIMAGLYADGKPNLQVFKKGWTGDEAISDDRITREGTRVDRPALVIGVTLQPTVLANLKDKEQFRREGLLGRFLFAQPEDRIGYRRTGDEVPPINETARDRYSQCLRILLEATPADEQNGEWIPNELPLSSEAAAIRGTFAEEIERSLRPGQDLDGLVDWGSKLVGNMVRVGGLIHLAWQVEEGGDLWDQPISARSMETAVNLGRTLIPHARHVFDRMNAEPKVRLARYVLRRITTYEGHDPLTKRELHRRCQGKKEVQRAADLREPLRLLQQHNLIRLEKQDPSGGRPPSPVIELNPRARDRIDESDRSHPKPRVAVSEPAAGE